MRFLAVIGALAIVLVIGAAIYFYGGYYNVAATSDSNSVVDRLVAGVREASVEHNVVHETPPVSLDDPQQIQRGAHEFVEEGCIGCHGGPGREPVKFAAGLNPEPPDLGRMRNPDPDEIFWIVTNGIRMTAMPAFGPRMDLDERWAVVSFVKNMQTVSAADFEAWTTETSPAPEVPAAIVPPTDTNAAPADDPAIDSTPQP
jgi:mono/diheme cytochrome c family protein